MNSSAGGSKNACRFRSTARTQNPSALSRLTRWPPIKPPAPFTSTLFMSTSSYDSINLGQCGTRMGLGTSLYEHGFNARDARLSTAVSFQVRTASLAHLGESRAPVQGVPQHVGERSEERRVGKECRSRWSPDH